MLPERRREGADRDGVAGCSHELRPAVRHDRRVNASFRPTPVDFHSVSAAEFTRHAIAPLNASGPKNGPDGMPQKIGGGNRFCHWISSLFLPNTGHT